MLRRLLKQARVTVYGTAVGPIWAKGKRKVERVLYRGSNVECPVCGAHYREFLPLHHPVLQTNIKCLSCESRPRHRMLWLYLRDELPFFGRKLRLLHVAPEAAFQDRFRGAPGIDYASFDKVSPLADVHGDLTELPFPDGSFDAILCLHVLDYIADDARAMRELKRVLAPGGFAVIQIPIDLSLERTDEDLSVTDPAEQLRRFRLEGHFRVYGRDYVQRLEAAGFSVETVPYPQQLGPEATRRYALPLDEPLFICR